MASAVPTAATVTGTAFRSARAVTTGTEPAAPRPPPRPPRPLADAPFGLSPGDEHEFSSSGNATRIRAGRVCLGMRFTIGLLVATTAVPGRVPYIFTRFGSLWGARPFRPKYWAGSRRAGCGAGGHRR